MICTNLSPFGEDLRSGALSSGFDLMERVDKAGFDGLEVNLQILQHPSARKLLDGLDYSRVSFHSNYLEFTLAASNRYVREGCIRQLTDEIALAGERGVRLLTFHPGGKGKGITREQSLDNLRASLEALRPKAEEAHVTLCLENMDDSPDRLCSAAEEIRRTLARLPWVPLTCDFAHLALTGADIGAFLDEFAPRIAHAHVSGALPGTSHGNVSLPMSAVDLRPHLARMAGREIRLVIENKSLPLALESRDELRRIFRRG